MEAERNFYESQLIILDTLEKVLNSVSAFEYSFIHGDFVSHSITFLKLTYLLTYLLTTVTAGLD